MYDLDLDGYGKILIIQRSDLEVITHSQMRTRRKIAQLVNASRARYRAVVIEMAPEMGKTALPKEFRHLPIKGYSSEFGSVWLMEQDERGVYV